jgi:secretion/DNA translocation related TadE-like protein
MTPMRRDEGVAIVWALALVSVLVVTGLLGAAVGERAIERQGAAAAADVAALAAAQSSGDPCGHARASAAANDVQLVSCTLEDGDVVVRVTRPASSMVRRLLALVGKAPADVMAVARAGPP